MRALFWAVLNEELELERPWILMSAGVLERVPRGYRGTPAVCR